MSEKQQKTAGPQPLLSDWMKTATEIWGPIVSMWTELYENEFRRFFNIPQVGLTRSYQEKVIRTVDQINIFQATMAEFMHLLFQPVEKSFHVMQEKLTAWPSRTLPFIWSFRVI